MKVLATIAAVVVASQPFPGLAADLLVVNKGDATLSIIDPASGQTRATVQTGPGPHEVEVSADGRFAFVSNYGTQEAGNTLSVIDLEARTEARRVDLGELRRPHGLSIAQGQVYFSAEAARKVGRYDPLAGRVDWTFATDQSGTHMVLATPDAARLFTTNIGSASVSLIERGADGQWLQTVIGVGAGPEGLDLSPDGRQLWTAHTGDGAISIIDVASRRVSHTFDAGTKRSNRLKFSPDGKLVLVSDVGAGELVVIDAQQRVVRARLAVGQRPTGILLAPDGRHAYVAVTGDNRIAVIDLQTLSIARTIATGNNPDGMAWSGPSDQVK